MEEGSAIVEIFALKLFKKADDADRQAIYDQNVAKLYKASADLMEVTKQFGDLSDDVCCLSYLVICKVVNIFCSDCRETKIRQMESI